jgi:hypothetical protein
MSEETSGTELEGITSALDRMKEGDSITFPNGAIASRHDKGWNVSLPPDDDQAFYNSLLESANSSGEEFRDWMERRRR